MATDDRQVLVTGTAPAPADFLVPGNGQIRPKSVFAHFDGSAAAASFLPVLKIISDGGEVVALCPTTTTTAAGGSADVTWFQGVGGGGGGAVQTLVGARILATSAQTVAANTDTDLHYNAVDFDTDGMADLGSDNRKLTVQTAGLYIVICQTGWVYDSSGRRINGIIHNNFVSVSHAFDATSGGMAVWAPVGGDGFGGPRTACSTVALFQASAGDFFSSGAFQASGGNLNCNGQVDDYLSAILLGQ